MKKIFDIVFWLLIILLLGSALLFSVSEKKNKAFFSYRFYNVSTNSMWTDQSIAARFKGESFAKGDLIIIKITKPEKIKVGEVITFTPTGIDNASIYLTHRVIEKHKGDELTFITRGDANNTDDPEITGEQVIGRVRLAIPFLGKIVQGFKDHLLLSVLMIVVIILFTNFNRRVKAKKAS